MTDSLPDAVSKFYQVYNEGNLELWEEAMSPSYVGHVNRQDVPNRETGKGFIQALLGAFPNINYNVHDALTEGDKIVTRWTATATHTGDLFGMPPTNKDVTMMGITIFRVADGQIQELWDVWDQAGLMEQLNN